MAVRHQSLYVSGGFVQISGVVAPRIAAWNGSNWSAVPAVVDDLRWDFLLSDGRYLYTSTTSGGVARWDGTGWTQSDDLEERPQTIAVAQDGTVYAGGGGGGCHVIPTFPYNTVCERQGFGVKRWTDNRWATVGSGLLVVDQLAFDPSGVLYAIAADYDSCEWESCVWRLENGYQWTRVGNLRLNLYGSDLAIDGHGTVFVSGVLRSEPGEPSGVTHWDGSAWSTIKSGLCADFIGLDDQKRIHASFSFGDGRAYIERWTGESWEAVDSQLTGDIRSLATYQSSLYASGSFTGPNGVERTARLEDGVWQPIVRHGLGVDGSVSTMSVLEDGSVLVEGYFSHAGELEVPGRAAWDGTAWREIDPPDQPSGTVDTRAVGPDGTQWVSGNLEIDGGEYRLARHDGTSWVGVVDSLTKDSGMNGPWIQRIAVDSNGDVFVMGNFSAIDGFEANRVARWDGERWEALGGGLGTGTVSSALFDRAGQLYVGGNFSEAGGRAANGVARWDGEAWHALGGGVGNPSPYEPLVTGMVFVGDRLYVGGYFQTAGDEIANYIASWDGERWEPLESGVNEPVSVLAAGPDGDLFVGGQFLWASSVRADRVARWTGDHWEALGRGVRLGIPSEYSNPHVVSVRALAFDKQGALMIGGWGIRTSGGVAASGISRWLKTTGIVIDPPAEVPAEATVAVSIYPNPQIGYATAVVSLGVEQQVRIDVHDALGRQIALLYDGELSADAHEISLDTRSWSAGLYIVRAVGERGSAERALIHVR